MAAATSNPATFNPRSGRAPPRSTTTRTARRSTGCSTAGRTRTSPSATSAQAASTPAATTTTASAASFSGSNINYLDVPADLQHHERLRGQPVEHVHGHGQLQPLQHQRRPHAVTSNWHGQHAFKVGVQYERIGNDVNTGQQYPNVSIVLERARGRRSTTGRCAARTATTRSCSSTRVGDIHSNNIGLFLQDQWTFNDEADDQLRRPLRLHEHPVLPRRRTRASSSAGATRSRRASASPTTSRATASGRSSARGASSTTSRSSRCRAARGAPITGCTYYWTLDNYNWPAINCDGTPD